VHEAHCSCFAAFLARFAYRVPHGKWNLAVFDVSSQGHDLVGVHVSLIKFLLSPKAELDIDESRQVIPLVPFLLETLPTLPLCHLPEYRAYRVTMSIEIVRGKRFTAFLPENSVPLLGGHPFEHTFTYPPLAQREASDFASGIRGEVRSSCKLFHCNASLKLLHRSAERW
jgi:hypothetical protein